MSQLLLDLGDAGLLLALLVLGHALGDYVLQNDAIVRDKRRWPVLGLHGLLVTLSHALALMPFLSPRVIIAVVAIGLTHVVIDRGKLFLKHRTEKPLAWFTLDQLLHLLVLLVAWWWLTRGAAPPVAWLPGAGWLSAETTAWLTRGAVLLVVFIFNHKGANAFVRAVLPDTGGTDQAHEDDLQAGRLIGTLERYIVLLLAIPGQWSAIALVIAAKSIARFEELKDRPFAEYYLVGTLTSVLVAILSGLLVTLLI